MSEVEETIERIKVQNHGVEGYVICNKQGQVCFMICMAM